MSVQQKLADLGLELPAPPQPLGSYTAVSEAGNLLFISGQVPLSAERWSIRGASARP
ncbi:enamine deaminase RidA (YjgF/YER057c/UK114 family) [Paraburkholderia sp. JPY681]|nr:enamine deaminase RidA (YjgF/YER057c/UK114 family) [Paraburkholderia atlantica]